MFLKRNVYKKRFLTKEVLTVALFEGEALPGRQVFSETTSVTSRFFERLIFNEGGF